jgi:hypothetical protein
MELSFEVVKKVNAECRRFWAQTDPKSCTVPELINQFIKSTDSTLPETLMLHSFAFHSYDHLGWSGLCEVYEYILANDLDPGGESMNYDTWTFIGMGVMKDVENHSFDERVRVAADVEALFEREAKESGYYSEINMAYFYYDHPLKAEQPQFYLLKSKEWFERAIESDECNECDHHVLQTLGHVFFELGDFKTALHWYKKYVAVGNYCGDACVFDHALTEKRLFECQQRMTEQE